MESRLQLAAGIAVGIVGVVWLLRQLSLRRGRRALRDKVVLITGASSGVGEALAHAFYRAGAKVILCARRVKELERVKKDLSSLQLGIPAHTPRVLPLDLEDLDAIPGKAQEALALHGRIDVLINNGGMGFRGTALQTEIAVHQKIMTVNYFGSVELTKALLPSMISNRSGHIVAISSVQGRIAIPFRSAYAASKHAMQAFFDSLRAEIAEHDVNVSVISPGYIKTNYSYNAVLPDGSRHGEMDRTIATGMSPDYVVGKILGCIIRKDPELVLAPFHHRAAIWIRLVAPRLYAFIMAKRARSSDD